MTICTCCHDSGASTDCALHYPATDVAASSATPALEQLIAKWRGFAVEPIVMPSGFDINPEAFTTWFNGRNATYRACANELAAALADLARLPAPQEEK